MPVFRRRRKSLEDLRSQLIRETELGLYIGLKFPERVPRIPSIEVGRASFDPKQAEAFWLELLGDMEGLYRFARRNPHLIPLGEEAILTPPGAE